MASAASHLDLILDFHDEPEGGARVWVTVGGQLIRKPTEVDPLSKSDDSTTECLALGLALFGAPDKRTSVFAALEAALGSVQCGAISYVRVVLRFGRSPLRHHPWEGATTTVDEASKRTWVLGTDPRIAVVRQVSTVRYVATSPEPATVPIDVLHVESQPRSKIIAALQQDPALQRLFDLNVIDRDHFLWQLGRTWGQSRRADVAHLVSHAGSDFWMDYGDNNDVFVGVGTRRPADVAAAVDLDESPVRLFIAVSCSGSGLYTEPNETTKLTLDEAILESAISSTIIFSGDLLLAAEDVLLEMFYRLWAEGVPLGVAVQLLRRNVWIQNLLAAETPGVWFRPRLVVSDLAAADWTLPRADAANTPAFGSLYLFSQELDNWVSDEGRKRDPAAIATGDPSPVEDLWKARAHDLKK